MCNQMMLQSSLGMPELFLIVLLFGFLIWAAIWIRWWRRPHENAVVQVKRSGLGWPYVAIGIPAIFGVVMFLSLLSVDSPVNPVPVALNDGLPTVQVNRRRTLPGTHLDRDLSEAGLRRLPSASVSDIDPPATSAWDENIAPVANIYPGIPECGKPLAAKLVAHLQDEQKSREESPQAEAETVSKYRVALKNSGLDQPDFLNFLINFRKEFTAAFPGSFVDDMTASEYPTPQNPDKEKKLQRFFVTVYHSGDGHGGVAKWDDRMPRQALERSGQIVCQLGGNGRMGQIEFAGDFIEKAWVADADKFVSRWPKRKFIIGFSPRLARSEQEARVSALRDANVRLAKSTNKIFSPNYDMERNVVDRFIQKLTMPYGSVWREAVLVDHGLPNTSFQRFYGDNRVAVNIALGERQRTSSARSATPAVVTSKGSIDPEAMLAGLMFLTVVLGWISNRMTQGYYRGQVWTVAGTLFCVGAATLVLIVIVNFA